MHSSAASSAAAASPSANRAAERLLYSALVPGSLASIACEELESKVRHPTHARFSAGCGGAGSNREPLSELVSALCNAPSVLYRRMQGVGVP